MSDYVNFDFIDPMDARKIRIDFNVQIVDKDTMFELLPINRHHLRVEVFDPDQMTETYQHLVTLELRKHKGPAVVVLDGTSFKLDRDIWLELMLCLFEYYLGVDGSAGPSTEGITFH